MYYDFSSREKNIIHYLSINDAFITGKQLALLTGVSERTIRNDIKRINEIIYAEDLDDAFVLSSVHTKGYRFVVKDINRYKSFIKDLDYDANSLEKELVNFREREIRLLVILQNKISINKLSEMLYFSEQTIRSLIRKINNATNRIQYKFHVVNGCIEVSGDEKMIRIATLKTIYVNPEYKGISNEIFHKISNPEYENRIYKILEEYFKENNNLNVSSLALQYISKALWISNQRNQMGNNITFSHSEKAMLKNYHVEYMVAKEIMNGLKKSHFLFLEEDTFFMLLILISFSNRKDMVLQEIDSKSLLLCVLVTQMVEKEFPIIRKDIMRSLKESLFVYFFGFKIRNHFDINRQYMGVTRVKRKLIVASEYSRKIVDIMEVEGKLKISDKEIIFLSVCLAQGIESTKYNKKLKVLVVSIYGYCEAKRYAAQLEMIFMHQIKEMEICEIYEIESKYEDFDVIFVDDESLVNDDNKFEYYEAYSTYHMLHNNVYHRLSQAYDNYWFYYHLNQDCFLTNLDLKTKVNVFEYIETRFMNQVKAQWNTVEDLFKHDAKLTFECGHKIALIGLISQMYEDNTIHFMILKNAISWNQRFVQNVIVVRMKSYQELQKYEVGIQRIIGNQDNSSLLIAEANLQTLQKILGIEI